MRNRLHNNILMQFGVGGYKSIQLDQLQQQQSSVYSSHSALFGREATTLSSIQSVDGSVGSPEERDLWESTEPSTDWIEERVVASRPKSADVKNRPKIAAVEVDPAGCSYNPDPELHQDVVAEAVAHENLKLIERELAPKVLLPAAFGRNVTVHEAKCTSQMNSNHANHCPRAFQPIFCSSLSGLCAHSSSKFCICNCKCPAHTERQTFLLPHKAH